MQNTGFGLLPILPESNSVQYMSETQGFVTRYAHVAYAGGYIVSREAMKDGQYEEVSGRRAERLFFSKAQTKEIVAANIYNRAITSGYTGGDGIVLLSASHTSTAGTWSNILAVDADLSEASLEDLIVQIMTAKNDVGHRIALIPQSLHVHPANWFNANRILKSALQNDTANNATNVLKLTNALPKGIKMNHYFDDEDAFFVRTNAVRGMIMYERENDGLVQDNDTDSYNAKAKTYERYSCGWTDPRGVYGTMGS